MRSPLLPCRERAALASPPFAHVPPPIPHLFPFQAPTSSPRRRTAAAGTASASWRRPCSCCSGIGRCAPPSAGSGWEGRCTRHCSLTHRPVSLSVSVVHAGHRRALHLARGHSGDQGGRERRQHRGASIEPPVPSIHVCSMHCTQSTVSDPPIHPIPSLSRLACVFSSYRTRSHPSVHRPSFHSIRRGALPRCSCATRRRSAS